MGGLHEAGSVVIAFVLMLVAAPAIMGGGWWDQWPDL